MPPVNRPRVAIPAARKSHSAVDSARKKFGAGRNNKLAVPAIVPHRRNGAVPVPTFNEASGRNIDIMKQGSLPCYPWNSPGIAMPHSGQNAVVHYSGVGLLWSKMMNRE